MAPKSYQERVWISWWVSLLFVGIIVFFSAVVVIQSIWGIPIGSRPMPTYLAVGLEIVFILLFINFSKLDIAVDLERIEVKYGVIKKTIPINEVASCETTHAKFRVYGGVGIRIGTDRSLAFTASFGNAIKIIRKRGHPFVFSTNKPTELSKLINTLAKPHA